MPDGNFALSKAHTYKSSRKQQIRFIVLEYLGPKYDRVEDKKNILDLSASYLAKYNNPIE